MLGRVDRCTNLTSEELEAVTRLCPDLHAVTDDAVIYYRLLSGVIYTNSMYKQECTNDYTLSFVDGTVGITLKYISVSRKALHIDIVNECLTSNGPCMHI